jgi:hypothetical protein
MTRVKAKPAAAGAARTPTPATARAVVGGRGTELDGPLAEVGRAGLADDEGRLEHDLPRRPGAVRDPRQEELGGRSPELAGRLGDHRQRRSDHGHPVQVVEGDQEEHGKLTLPLRLVNLQGCPFPGSISVVLAGVVVSLLPVLAVYLVGQRYLVERIMMGGLKG